MKLVTCHKLTEIVTWKINLQNFSQNTNVHDCFQYTKYVVCVEKRYLQTEKNAFKNSQSDWWHLVVHYNFYSILKKIFFKWGNVVTKYTNKSCEFDLFWEAINNLLVSW